MNLFWKKRKKTLLEETTLLIEEAEKMDKKEIGAIVFVLKIQQHINKIDARLLELDIDINEKAHTHSLSNEKAINELGNIDELIKKRDLLAQKIKEILEKVDTELDEGRKSIEEAMERLESAGNIK